MQTASQLAGAAREIAAARRVCFFAHHDMDDIVDPYVLYYLGALRDAGFSTVLASTSRLPAAEVAKLDGLCADVIVRDNVGLDFGGWADCLARYPGLSAEYLLLCNDSVYGPFWEFTQFIDDLTAESADFYGALLSIPDGVDYPEHLQSWFLLLRPSAYNSAAFRQLLAPVPATLGRDEIIIRYECQLTRKLEAAGLSYRAAFDPREHGPLLAGAPMNLSFVLWKELLVQRRFPFLKVRLLCDRTPWVAGLDRWRDVANSLNPQLTQLAEANVARRTRDRRTKPLERLRIKAFMLTQDGVHLPQFRRLLVEDMERAAGRGRRAVLPPSTRFRIVQAVRATLLAPYRLAYNTGSAIRRGPRRKAG